MNLNNLRFIKQTKLFLNVSSYDFKECLEKSKPYIFTGTEKTNTYLNNGAKFKIWGPIKTGNYLCFQFDGANSTATLEERLQYSFLVFERIKIVTNYTGDLSGEYNITKRRA